MSASAISLVSSLETRLLLAKLLVGAVIGLCVGALIGGLAFGVLVSDTTATAFLRLQNPADLTAIAGGANQVTPDNQDNTGKFVTGEIAYLTGEGFAQAVATKMARDDPAVLNVAQASGSAVISMSCSRKSADEAVRTVQTAIDLYSQLLAQRADVQLRALLPTLSDWQQRDAADPMRTLELQRARESIEIQSAHASTLMVVQPPIPNHPSSHQWVIGVFLGALVGGSGAVAVLLARRRRSGRGSLVKTLTAGVDGVLLPAVDLDMPPEDAWAEDQARLARALYAQCRSAGPNRVILVLGASASSGSSVVASLLEFAAAESQSIAAGANSSGQHSAPSFFEPPTTRVVAAVIGDSTLPLDIIGAATDILLVAQIEVDTIADALALHSATASSVAPVMAVFTYRRPQGGKFGRPRSEAKSLAPAPHAGGLDEQLVAE